MHGWLSEIGLLRTSVFKQDFDAAEEFMCEHILSFLCPFPHCTHFACYAYPAIASLGSYADEDCLCERYRHRHAVCCGCHEARVVDTLDMETHQSANSVRASEKIEFWLSCCCASLGAGLREMADAVLEFSLRWTAPARPRSKCRQCSRLIVCALSLTFGIGMLCSRSWCANLSNVQILMPLAAWLRNDEVSVEKTVGGSFTVATHL